MKTILLWLQQIAFGSKGRQLASIFSLLLHTLILQAQVAFRIFGLLPEVIGISANGLASTAHHFVLSLDILFFFSLMLIIYFHYLKIAASSHRTNQLTEKMVRYPDLPNDTGQGTGEEAFLCSKTKKSFTTLQQNIFIISKPIWLPTRSC